jgi:hypothetical protein
MSWRMRYYVIEIKISFNQPSDILNDYDVDTYFKENTFSIKEEDGTPSWGEYNSKKLENLNLGSYIEGDEDTDSSIDYDDDISLGNLDDEFHYISDNGQDNEDQIVDNYEQIKKEKTLISTFRKYGEGVVGNNHPFRRSDERRLLGCLILNH